MSKIFLLFLSVSFSLSLSFLSPFFASSFCISWLRSIRGKFYKTCCATIACILYLVLNFVIFTITHSSSFHGMDYTLTSSIKDNSFLKNGPNPFCLFSFFSHDKYSANTINEKTQMACLGLEPRAAGWQAQTNPLSYGGTPKKT